MLHQNKQSAGFTLIELLVTLSVGAIILSIAVPSFGTMLRSNRTATQANSMLASLNLARSESAKRGVRASVCPRKQPATDPETCAGNTDWSGGWLVFTDATGTRGTFDGTDSLLRISGALNASPTFTATAASVQYRPTGAVDTSVTFTLTPNGCKNKERRTIKVGATGRAAVDSAACP